MTYRALLLEHAARFAASESPFLDAVLLLAESLGTTKERVLAMLPERAESVPEAFYLMAERRQRGESVAHILGRKEFYGREFLVNDKVLSPRQDTEVLVDAVLETGDAIDMKRHARSLAFGSGEGAADEQGADVHGEAQDWLRVLDLCTGSGAVAISIAAERPEWIVAASDISRDALDVAKKNAVRLVPHARIDFFESDLFARIEGKFDVICANPPYVPHDEAVLFMASGWTDPLSALDGGADGMDFIHAIIEKSTEYLSANGVLLLEMDPLQVADASALLGRFGFWNIRTWNDLAGRTRVVGAFHG